MMNSPVHSFLFSPPTSPPLPIGSGLTESHPLHSLKDLLLPTAPSPSQGYTRNPKTLSPLAAVQIISNAQAGPGGFNSTSAYPSRYSGMRRPSTAERKASPPPSLPAFVTSDTNQTTENYEKFTEKADFQRRRSSANGSAKAVSPSLSFFRTVKSSFTRRRGYRYGLLFVGMLIGIYFFYTNKKTHTTPHRAQALYKPSGALSPEEIREKLAEMAQQQAFFKTISRVTGGKKVPANAPAAEEDASGENEGGVDAVASVRTTEIHHLSPERELLALQAYLLESTSNEVVPSVDPNVPLDPTMMVSFDANDEQGWIELKRETDPVVIWDVGLAETKTTYEILEHYAILPAPRIFKLKHRGDARRIHSIFSRLVPGRTLDLERPLITIGGAPVDGYEALVRHHEDGTLAEMLTEAGAVVDGRKDADRAESERKRKGRPIRLGKVERVVRA